MTEKLRLDVALTEKGFAESREKAIRSLLKNAKEIAIRSVSSAFVDCNGLFLPPLPRFAYRLAIDASRLNLPRPSKQKGAVSNAHLRQLLCLCLDQPKQAFASFSKAGRARRIMSVATQ